MLRRVVVVFVVLFGWLFAETTLYPAKACALYNNLKHTVNRDNVYLDMTQSYTMLKHHKGQYLIKVPGATPPQRWVDDDCLTLRPLKGTPLYEKKVSRVPGKIDNVSSNEEMTDMPQPLVLALSWQNAFCETHRNKKECRRRFWGGRSDNRFTLHGLWPQPREKVYCGVSRDLVALDKRGQWSRLPEPKLSKKTYRSLKEVMPGVVSYLHRHEWIKHGTCYGADAESYFSHAVALTRRVNDSKVSALFARMVGKRITLQQVRFAVDQSFGKGAGKRVELRCRRGMVTEIWLHLYGTAKDDLSTLLHRSRKVRSRCTSGIVDAPGWR